jgi:hypothetical protein
MGKMLKSYLFWTYPRGSFHYDVMVTFILAFIFLSPVLINYRDRPQETVSPASGILVKENGDNALVYEIGGGQVKNAVDGSSLRTELLARIQSISGNVQIDRYIVLRDAGGHVIEYRVWAHR